jgi:S1-C subfamily serine protease
VAVVQVVEGSAAERGGLRSGDVLLALDGVALEDATDLQRLMVDERIGRPLDARVLRDGADRTLTVVPDELVA